MPTAVIDASAAGAILFDEAGSDEVLDRIAGYDLFAPELIRNELVSIAVKKHRQRPELRSELMRALRRYSAMLIQEREVVPDAVFALAIETGLTAYDASYRWLARQLGVPLVTLDGHLAKAAVAA